MKSQTKKLIHLFRSHDIEVGCTRRGRPSYRWTTGWAKVTRKGYTAPLTLSNWRGMAKRDGRKIVLHGNDTKARIAALYL